MIDPLAYPVLAGVAVLSGFVDAVAGGGGLLTIPAMLTAGVPPVQALATNKVQSMFGVGTALRNFARGGLVDWRSNRRTVVLVFAGACAGAFAVQRIDPGALALVVSLLLVAAALYILLSPRMTDEGSTARIESATYAPVGGAIGVYDGFFGPATGALFTTSLVGLRGMGLTRATATTKLFNFSSNVASVLLFALGGKVVWLLGFSMAAGAMLGGWIGSRTALRYGARLIRPLLVVISLGLTARLLWTYFG